MKKQLFLLLFTALVFISGALVFQAQAQSRNPASWYVFVNSSVVPAQIGVAQGSYSVPGWGVLAGPYSGCYAAWKSAIRFNKMKAYTSPTIQQGADPLCGARFR